MMELLRSVGKLTQAVDTLIYQQREKDKKLDKISHRVYAALVVLILIGGILGFFAKGINDIIVHRLETRPVQVSPHQETPPQR